MQNTGTREMDDAKGFSLGERQFLEFAFALIGFRLTVGCAGELIVRVKRAGGPLAKTIIRKRRAQELHRADREQKEKRSVPGDTNHDLSPRKSDHRTMSSTLSAIPPDFHATQAPKRLIRRRDQFHHPMLFPQVHTGGIPSRVPSAAAIIVAPHGAVQTGRLITRTRCQRRRQFGLQCRCFVFHTRHFARLYGSCSGQPTVRLLRDLCGGHYAAATPA